MGSSSNLKTSRTSKSSNSYGEQQEPQNLKASKSSNSYGGQQNLLNSYGEAAATSKPQESQNLQPAVEQQQLQNLRTSKSLDPYKEWQQLRFTQTDFPPFKSYGVEGWWLDNLLKAGKLDREVYLRLAAQVTVGFQKRLADCRAAERLEHDLAVQEAVDAAAADLRVATLPMKRFAVVEARG